MGVNDGGHSRNASSEGTCARTRPFGFVEIMLRRKTKNILADVKEGASDTRGLLEKNDTESAYERSVSVDIRRLIKRGLKHAEGGPRKKQNIEMDKREDHLQHGYKDKHNLSAEMEMKCGNGGKSNSEKQSKSYLKNHYRSRNHDKQKIEFQKEPKRKQSENSPVNDKDLDKDDKSERGGKKIHQARKEAKTKPEVDRFILKKRDLSKLPDFERSRRHEPRKSRRRRSKSRETYHKREKSVSLSPRPRKRSYHEESSSSHFKDRSGRLHYDPKKGRMSQTGGYEKRHHKSHGSRIGGYSPRKRRSNEVIKSLSPKVHSPNKRIATWDQPPAGSLPANIHSTSNDPKEFPSSHDITNVSKAQQASLPKTPETVSDTSAYAIELTQATRPMRRLYIENIPPSTSDKAITEWLNSNLLSSGCIPVQKNPCISCIINNEKCHAVVEFLTPEDATTALSFHGKVFSGSILKMRRPKDFIDTLTGTHDKSSLIVVEGIQTNHAVSDVVKDSAHKIFIGGISKSLSPAMLMDIVTVFGPLKSYHFEINDELNEPCAFLEYMDKSITLKALTGLNGLKLGGQILIVVKTLLDGHLDEENVNNLATYAIPEHARPLLQSPTRILKLKNVFNPEEFMLLSEPELEETLEDIRLECARFGTVKSINAVRCSSIVCGTIDETLKIESKDTKKEQETPGIDDDLGVQSVVDNVLEKLSSDYCSPSRTDISEEHPETNDGNMFEPGCILVEFLREEATWMAVCCLNGRLYGDRVVSTSYASYDAYMARF